MEEKVLALKRYATLANVFFGVWLFSFVLLGASLWTLLSSGDMPSMFWLAIGLSAISYILFMVYGTKRNKTEQALIKTVAPTFENPIDARDHLVELGVRRRFANHALNDDMRRYRERETDARREKSIATAKLRCKDVLRNANKPKNCNQVELIDANDFFDDLENFQAKTVWEVWRSQESLCFYANTIRCYPTASAEGPYAFLLDLCDIQYFRQIGSVKSELQISGGTIKQDKRTGKVSQTPLKTRTVEHDNRLCDLTLRQNGIITHLYFDAEDFDVFFALMPEKEFARVMNG